MIKLMICYPFLLADRYKMDAINKGGFLIQ